MKRARSTFVTVAARNLVATLRDLFVEKSPKWHATRKVEDRHERPQHRQPSRKVSKRIGAAVPLPRRRYNPHLIHQLLKAQIRIELGYRGIVKRNKLQATLAIKSTKMVDLTTTDIALSIKEDDILLDFDCSDPETSLKK